MAWLTCSPELESERGVECGRGFEWVEKGGHIKHIYQTL